MYIARYSDEVHGSQMEGQGATNAEADPEHWWHLWNEIGELGTTQESLGRPKESDVNILHEESQLVMNKL